MIRRVFSCLFVVPALSGALAFAQPAKPSASADSTTTTFQVMGVSKSPVFSELYYLRSQNDAIPLKISTGRLSDQSLAASTTTPIVFAVKRNDAQGKPSFVPVAQVNWPQGAEKAAVFLAVSGTGASTKVQVVAVDHGLKTFPPRSTRVLNFTGRPLLGQFGDFKGEIAPGPGKAVSYPTVKIPEGATVGRFPVAFGMMDKQGQPSVFFNGFTEAWASARTMIVITPPTGTNAERPQVRFVLDALPPQPAARK